VLVCALATVAVLLSAAPAGAASRQHCAQASTAIRDKGSARLAAQDALLCLLNVERRKRGLRPLTANRRLQAAALGQSQWMVRHRVFSHFRPAGPDLVARLRQVHYIPRRGSWLVGENIGFGWRRRSSPAQQVRAWMGSSLHRANILNPTFRAAGLGIWSGTPLGARFRGATYTTTFGSRR
jgi:uncharacterized protein YkwD